MEDEKVMEKLDSILRDKYGFDDEKISKMRKIRFLSSEIGFSAANLFELFLEIEKEFGISFSEKEILNTQFDSYRELVKIIYKKQEEHK